MNERIKELARQASKELDPTAGCLVSDTWRDKFAELIVGECANVLDPDGEYTEKYKHSHTPGPDGLRQILSPEHFYEMKAANKLKEHFGVKE